MKKNNKDFYYILKKKCLNHTISKSDGQIKMFVPYFLFLNVKFNVTVRPI